MEDIKLYLNGREYSGSVYFLTGCRDEKEEGILCAFCWGPSWGMHSPGTCLAYLQDQAGNLVIKKEYSGCSGRYDSENGFKFE